MALCRITGTVYLPNGQPATSQEIQFYKADTKIKAGYLGAILPDVVTTTTSTTGELAVDLITGHYKMYGKTDKTTSYGIVTVPDTLTANISDILEFVAVPNENPTWVTQVLTARDEVQSAVETLEEVEPIARQIKDSLPAISQAEANANTATLAAQSAVDAATSVQTAGIYNITVGGTANAITGTMPAGVTLQNNTTIKFLAPGTNTGAVTITIGGVTYAIQSQTGKPLVGGEFVNNSPIQLRRITGTVMRIEGASGGDVDTLKTTVSTLAPTLLTLTNANNLAARTLTNYTTPNTDLVLNPNGEGGIIAQAPPNKSNYVAVNDKVTVRRRGDLVVMTYYNTTTNMIYEMTYSGSTWSAWVKIGEATVNGPALLSFGDSITAGVGVGANDPDGYALRTAALLNSSITRLATAGRCMSGTTAGDFIPAIDLAANATAIAAARVIWVAYGTNDWGQNVPLGTISNTTNGTFYGAMQEGVTKLRALNPTAPIVFLTPIYRGKAYSNPLDWTEAGPNSLGLYVEDYRKAIRTFCAANNLPVSEMSYGFEINEATAATYLPSDALHPGRLGHRVMADALAKRLKIWNYA